MSEQPATQQVPIDSKYEVISELGRGGFGVVYKARQLATGQWVAIKQLHQNKHAPANIMAEQHHRFWREVKLIGKLHSPYTVRLVDAGLDDNQPYMVLEFIDGRPLADLLGAGPIAPALTRRLMCQVLEGVAEAHQRGIVHRDLKPPNIMVTGDDDLLTAKVLDFGIAGIQAAHKDSVMETVTKEGQIRGTPSYMAPEQIQGPGDPCPQTDVFALGLILLECLTGEKAVEGDSLLQICFRQVHEQLEIPPAIQASGFGPIIEKACAKEVDDRYAHAGDMLRALRAVSDDAFPDATKGQWQTDAMKAVVSPGEADTWMADDVALELEPPSRRNVWIGVVVALLAVVGIGVALTQSSRDDHTPTDHTAQANAATPEVPPTDASRDDDRVAEDARRKAEQAEREQRAEAIAALLTQAQSAQAAAKYHDAKVHFSKVLELDAENTEAQEALAWIHYQNKEYDKAIAAFKGLPASRFEVAAIGLARAHKGAGNTKASIDYYQQYLRRYPAGAMAMEAQAAIQANNAPPEKKPVEPPEPPPPPKTKTKSTTTRRIKKRARTETPDAPPPEPASEKKTKRRKTPRINF